MSFIDFPINLDRVASALEKIANCLERAYSLPPPGDLRPIEVAQLSDLKVIDSAADERRQQDRADLALRYGVVPDSPAFEEALKFYEEQRKRFYAEEKAIDWEEAFNAAAGTRDTAEASKTNR